jgi:hypothetical protein
MRGSKMTTPRTHAALIKAWADGAIIEMKIDGRWVQQDFPTWGDFQEFQIQVPKPWYRVALMNNGAPRVASSPEDEVTLQENLRFQRWLTLRIEYDAS